MFSLEDCKRPDGSTDWTRYNELKKKEDEARIEKGELCRLCRRYIVWAKGYPQSCAECKAIDNPGELHHDREVRCPKCGHHWGVGDGEDYELYAEDAHPVTCGECNYDFEVVTHVSYTFVSPERIKPMESQDEP